MRKEMMEIVGTVSAVGGALVGLHGVTNRRWQIARSVFIVTAAVALAIARYHEDGDSLGVVNGDGSGMR